MYNELNKAYSKYKDGLFLDAKEICFEILNKDINNFDCYNLLGLIEIKIGNLDKSIEYFLKSISINPNSENSYNNYAISLKAKGLLNDAIKNFEKAISIRGDFIEAHYNKANLFLEINDYDSATASYLKILSINKNHLGSLNNLGTIYFKKENYNLALNYFDLANYLSPEDLSILINKINTLNKLEKYNESLNILKKKDSIYKFNYFFCLIFGNTLEHLELYEEALIYYEKANDLKKNDLGALYNKANVLKKLKRFKESLSYYNEVLKINKNFLEAINNKAELLEHLQQYDEALLCYNQAINIDPSNYEIKYNRSLLLIRLNNFNEGWTEHEIRWKTNAFKKQLRNITKKNFEKTSEILNKIILVTHEQGFGDSIQFSRYLPLLETKCSKVFFETPNALIDLYKTSFPKISFLSNENKFSDFDFHCSLMSFPYIFRTNPSNIPGTKGYIFFDQEKKNILENKIGIKKKPRIGLSWSGNLKNPKEKIRSIPLNQFKKILELDCDFYCLQKDISDDDKKIISNYKNLNVFDDHLINFHETAVLCDLMDLIISVDTSIAHLAGSLGKRTWLLLSYNPDYRWGLNEHKCKWYDFVSFYRQKLNTDWNVTIDRVYKDIKSIFNLT